MKITKKRGLWKCFGPIFGFYTKKHYHLQVQANSKKIAQKNRYYF